jgi:hypothetical protein
MVDGRELRARLSTTLAECSPWARDWLGVGFRVLGELCLFRFGRSWARDRLLQLGPPDCLVRLTRNNPAEVEVDAHCSIHGLACWLLNVDTGL